MPGASWHAPRQGRRDWRRGRRLPGPCRRASPPRPPAAAGSSRKGLIRAQPRSVAPRTKPNPTTTHRDGHFKAESVAGTIAGSSPSVGPSWRPCRRSTCAIPIRRPTWTGGNPDTKSRGPVQAEPASVPSDATARRINRRGSLGRFRWTGTRRSPSGRGSGAAAYIVRRFPRSCASRRCWKSAHEPAGCGVCGSGRVGGSSACSRTRRSGAAARPRPRRPGGRRPRRRREVGLLDQQGVIRRVAPGRAGAGTSASRMPERALGRGHGGDDLELGELLAGQAREVGPLVQELDQRGLAVEADAADEVVDLVAVEARRPWWAG